MTTKTILYLHGFNSGSQSEKAQQTQQFFTTHYPEVSLLLPDLSPSPFGAFDQIQQLFVSHPEINGIIGSSMGGFFATVFAEIHQVRAVLLNPAIKPSQLIQHFIGEHINPYTQQAFRVTPDFSTQLKSLQPKEPLTSVLYWLLVQMGDEVLDYQQAVNYYADSKQTVMPGGDHRFSDHPHYLPDIASFLLG